MSRILKLLLSVVLMFTIPPAECQLDAWIKKATESVVGKPNEVVVDIPACLVELQGGIQQVEQTLSKSLREGHRWVVLVTSSQDRLTAPAIMSYYEAVSELCSMHSDSGNVDLTESTEDIFENSGEILSSSTSESLATWHYAHLSFDTEPSLIWRWWIWKVPIILFISASTRAQTPYDIRYWKIAFELPRKDRIKDVIEGGSWHNLAIWQSRLAPGGTLAIIPSKLGQIFGVLYDATDPLPSWLLTILATAGGSLIISFLHRGQGR